jgi:hypothetical protein
LIDHLLTKEIDPLMTIADSIDNERPDIAHPSWCMQVPQDGKTLHHGRLASAEGDFEHRGREYRLDTGKTFAGSVTVQATQLYDDPTLEHEEPRIRVALFDHELEGPGERVYLSASEVDRLIAMLQRARSEITQ